MSDAYKEIMGLLPKCTPEEVSRLSVALKAWTSLPGGTTSSAAEPADDKDADCDFVLRCIIDVCRRNGVEIVSVRMLKQSRNYPTFKAKVPALMTFLQKASPKRNVQQAILCLAISAIRDWLLNLNIPVSAGNLLQHIHRVPDVLDQHFPGYARMGMLSSIFRTRKEKSCHYRKSLQSANQRTS